MKVQVYYGSQSVTSIEEVGKYNFESLLSSFGGALSLYLGVSLVALFELIEFAARLVLDRIRIR